jgi:two-component system response regulator DevR
VVMTAFRPRTFQKVRPRSVRPSACPGTKTSIIAAIRQGKTYKEIAAEVFLSDKTVKNYVSSILSKLNLQRRTQAAAFVAKYHLVPPDEG